MVNFYDWPLFMLTYGINSTKHWNLTNLFYKFTHKIWPQFKIGTLWIHKGLWNRPRVTLILQVTSTILYLILHHINCSFFTSIDTNYTNISGLGVMGDDSCLKGFGFRSWGCVLDEHDIFLHWFVVKIVMFIWKYQKEAAVCPFKNISDFTGHQTYNVVWTGIPFTACSKWLDISTSTSHALSGLLFLIVMV